VGIPRPVARLLMEEGRQRPFSGRLLQLGRGYVYLTWDELAAWARRDGFALRRDVEVTLSHEPGLAALGCLSDETFFRALGFDEVESCDLFAAESPTWQFDFNLPIPDELAGRFDVVLDPGSLVHLFDQRQAFRNLARLVREGGRVIHGTDPSSNNVDVGFYMLSPTLFADLYPANGWRLEELLFCLYEPLWHRGRFVPPVWDAWRYAPGIFDHLRWQGFGARPAAVWAVATRLPGAGMEILPVQGSYRRMYEGASPAVAAPPVATAAPPRELPGALALKRAARRLRRLGGTRLPPRHGRY
jgi:SAM-dependent methyltransferase